MKNKTKNIPVLILAGGLGTRISEETLIKPKPMVDIGPYPIILHIMKYYYRHGFNDFVICAGYLSKMIKEYFINYELHYDHVQIDARTDDNIKPIIFSNNDSSKEKWRVSVLDTGIHSFTGSRIAKALDMLEVRENRSFDTFAVTYGDGLTDCDLNKELEFHYKNKCIGTVLGVNPTSRFGEIDFDKDCKVTGFKEKPKNKNLVVSGGFFFFQKEFRKYLDVSDDCVLEKEPLENLAEERELCVYRHEGFWSCMDTLRDKNYLQQLWDSETCPWRN